MIVLKAKGERLLAALESLQDMIPRRNLDRAIIRCRATMISNGMSDIPGGGEVAEVGAEGVTDGPDVAASDDDDGDGDGDPDSDRRSRPRSKTSHPSFPPALLAFEPLSHYVSFGRSRIYQLIAAGEFPQPIKVGKSSRWVKAEIDAWISKQAATQQAEG